MVGSKYIIHKSEQNTTFYVMRKDGKSFVKIYSFKDDKKTGYISSLSVQSEIRKKGEGNELLKLAETFLKEKKFSHICLWVKNNSWMMKWYLRKGYTFQSKEKDCVWLNKKL